MDKRLAKEFIWIPEYSETVWSLYRKSDKRKRAIITEAKYRGLVFYNLWISCNGSKDKYGREMVFDSNKEAVDFVNEHMLRFHLEMEERGEIFNK